MSNPSTSRLRRIDERRLFATAAKVAVAIVLIGFAQSYYLKLLFGTPPLSGLLHLHGAVMTLWFVLFAAQIALVSRERTDLHRRLGLFTVAWACVVVAIGTLTAIAAARLGHSPGPPPLQFLIVPLTDMLTFAVLVALAVLWRRRSDVHKRLMLLASLSLLVAALARVPLLRDVGIVAAFATMGAIVLACVAYDRLRQGRLHPAFAWGALWVIGSWPLRLWLADSPQWLRVARWLAG